MANEKNLKPFPKGVSGNPLGGKLHNPVLRDLKKMSAADLDKIGNMLFKCNDAKLRKIYADPKTKFIHRMLAGVMLKAAKGDHNALETILKRLIGPVPQELKHSGSISGNQVQVILQLPDNGMTAKDEDDSK